MSRDPHERMAVLDLLELLPREDAERIVERLLMHDPSPRVRELAALHVEDVFQYPEAALALLDRALAAEEHRDVRAELEPARVELMAAPSLAADCQDLPRTVLAPRP